MSTKTTALPPSEATRHHRRRAPSGAFPLSATQLVASALAAITATVAASYLGVSGTVIGAAVASVMTVIGNAVYSHSLRRPATGCATPCSRAAPVARRADDAPPPARRAARPAPQPGAGRCSPPVRRCFRRVLIVVTGIELVAGRPISDLVRGDSGSGTTLWSTAHRRAADHDADADHHGHRHAAVVVATPTVTLTAAAGHRDGDADDRHRRDPPRPDAPRQRHAARHRRSPSAPAADRSLTLTACAASSDTSVRGQCSRRRGRGAAPPRVPRLRLRRRRGHLGRTPTCRSPRRPAGSRTWTRNSPPARSPAPPGWGTPGGPRTARRTTATPTRTPTRAAGSPSSTTASSRTSRTLRAELESAGVEFASETDTEAVAHLVAGVLERDGGSSPTPCGRSAAGWRARSRSSCSTPSSPTSSSRRGATPRWCSASATARRSSAATSPRSSSSPATRSSSARTRSSRSAATATRSPTSTATRSRAGRSTSTGTSPPPRRAATTTSCSRRSRSSRRRCATRFAATSSTATSSWTSSGSTVQQLRDVDKVFIVACGTAYHAGLIGKQAIEHWTRVPVEVEMASEFRYRDPVLDRQTLVVAISQSGETADTLEAVRHAPAAARERARDLQHQRRADPARVRRGALHARRPEIGVASTKTFLAQIAAVELVGLAIAQARGTKWGDEVVREFEQPVARCPTRSRRCSACSSRSARSPARSRSEGGAVPRPARRLSGRARGRAQAQGTRLHARRGVSGRRAQARPDRAHRGRPAGRRRHALADRTCRCCTRRCCPTSPRSRPAAPARS